MRRTKIVTTLGPATDREPVLEKLLLRGANVVRLNFSHGSADDHRARARQVRDIAARHHLNVALLADLQGPKLRIGKFTDKAIELEEGAAFCLDAGYPSDQGNQDIVGIDYKELPEDCNAGDILLLNDGRIELRVDRIDGPSIHCTVITGGPLGSNKGINRRGGGLSAPALTDKDKADIGVIADIGFDYVAVSFPKTAGDIELARSLLEEAGSNARIVAKIERAEAALDQHNMEGILHAADAVMVARGDLGVEIGDAALPGVQKRLIQSAREHNKLVIVATQMMESMIDNPVPTRDEVFDVANAVIDGADAVMLSAETAVGDYPVETVKTMAEICIGAEKQPETQLSDHRIRASFLRTDEAIAMATMYSANHLRGVKAIICLTESGNTPLWMSRISSGLPIYALTRHPETQRRMALFRGVESLHFDPTGHPYEFVNEQAVQLLKDKALLEADDLVIFTKGARMGIHGATNAMLILKV
ncbi:MAG: pyruvate kinase [Ketobacteraceae bacterium]|nr:pyruvate kinase [Ketobacteraceae bacterium]